MIYSNSYNQSIATNNVAPYLMLDSPEPPFGFEEEIESFRNGPDNMNVNIFNFGGDDEDFVVVSDYWNVYTVDPRTLATLKAVSPPLPNTHKSEFSIVLGTAHPLPEPGTNNFLTFLTVASAIPGQKSKMIFTRTKSAEQREVIATVEVDKASYMHSFAVTENYAILFAVPFYVNPLGMIKNLRPLDAFEWVSTDVTKLYVINLKTGNVQTLKTENMFFLHVANAYESSLFKNEIVIDVCSFKDTGGLHQMEMNRLTSEAARANSSIPILKRYTLNLSTGETNVNVFEPTNVPYSGAIDFPTINENYRGRRYCFLYGIAYNYDHKDFLHMALVKKDLCGGKDLSYVQAGQYLNEAFFVPRPGSTQEDDGVLILPVLDIGTKTTSFTIFNATDLTVLTSAVLPTNLPFGTHGHFFDYIV